jgi:hypothetical protein
MWKLDLKYKSIHRYIYDLISIYTHIHTHTCIQHTEREKIAIPGLSEGMRGRQGRKRE